MRTLAIVVAMAAGVIASSSALALEQPNGQPIPSEMGCDSGDPTGLAAVFACECLTDVCNIGDACPGNQDPNSCDDGQNGTCETTIWHDWNDNPCVPSNVSGLDPQAEASVLPETFSPTCPLTFTLVTRGTAIFGDVFGWYNVTGSEPDIDDLHVMLDCNASQGAEVVLDVLGHPDYVPGSEIGFFIATPESHSSSGDCAGGDCCATLARVAGGEGHIYYSERSYNPDEAGADSFIHLAIFDSQIQERKFYFAWEDIFGGSNNDFTDIVTSVSGVECTGGGETCDTGRDGVCAFGISTCQGADLGCYQLYDEQAEQCDALDNDCDGEIDEDATCANGEVCDNGRCLPDCNLGSEFECPTFTVCEPETGTCVDDLCSGISCAVGTVCRGGECVAPCDGIVCPVGSQCRFGDCVDPCEHVVCAEGDVCREGVCLPGCNRCDGIVCAQGLGCDGDTGQCFDPSCPDGCPDGEYCDSGECRDSCEDAVCPDGQSCWDGMCQDGEPPVGSGTDAGPDGGQPPGAGCCDSSTSNRNSWSAILLSLFVFVMVRRRRLLRSTTPAANRNDVQE
jgi:hypothetical protein